MQYYDAIYTSHLMHANTVTHVISEYIRSILIGVTCTTESDRNGKNTYMTLSIVYSGRERRGHTSNR